MKKKRYGGKEKKLEQRKKKVGNAGERILRNVRIFSLPRHTEFSNLSAHVIEIILKAQGSQMLPCTHVVNKDFEVAEETKCTACEM